MAVQTMFIPRSPNGFENRGSFLYLPLQTFNLRETNMKKILVLALVKIFFFASLSYAQESPNSELNNAIQAAMAARISGPQLIPLSNLAQISLDSKMGFIPPGPARNLMNALGNQMEGEVLGIVVPGTSGHGEMAILVANREGHIEDKDAKLLEANALIKVIKENTEIQNQERQNRGLPTMEVTGWDESPRYDSSQRMLVWSISCREGGERTINFVQVLLGRDTMLKVVTIGGNMEAPNTKSFARKVVEKISYVPGNRYEDFRLGVDKVAEYSLAALITGVAAKKIGLIAVLLAFLVKGWKILLAVVFFGVVIVAKVFGNKKDASTP